MKNEIKKQKNVIIEDAGKQFKVSGDINFKKDKFESKTYTISVVKVVENKIEESEVTIKPRQARSLAEVEGVFPLFFSLKENGLLDGKFSNSMITSLVNARESFELALVRLSDVDESIIADIPFPDLLNTAMDIFARDELLQELFVIWAKKAFGKKQ